MKIKEEILNLNTQRALMILWIECALDKISAKTYKEIQNEFQNKITKLEKEEQL